MKQSSRIRQLIIKYRQTILFGVMLLVLMRHLRFSPAAFRIYLAQTASLFPAVLGETVIFLAGSLDLSAGGTMVFEVALFGVMVLYNLPLWACVVLFTCMIYMFGKMKSFLVTWMQTDCKVITLILQFILIPLANEISSFCMNMGNRAFSFGVLGSMILPAAVTAGFAVSFFLNRTTYGKSIFILGRTGRGSEYSEADRKRLNRTAMILGSVLCGLGAFNIIVRTGVPTTFDGNGLSFQILAAVSLIGTENLSSRNAVIKSAFSTGVVVMLTALMQLYGLSSYGILTIYGLLILLSFRNLK